MIAEPPLDGGQVRGLTEPVSQRGKKQESGSVGARQAQGPPKERSVIAITDDVWYLDY